MGLPEFLLPLKANQGLFRNLQLSPRERLPRQNKMNCPKGISDIKNSLHLSWNYVLSLDGYLSQYEPYVCSPPYFMLST